MIGSLFVLKGTLHWFKASTLPSTRPVAPFLARMKLAVGSGKVVTALFMLVGLGIFTEEAYLCLDRYLAKVTWTFITK